MHEERLIPIPGADGPVWWEPPPEENARASPVLSSAAGPGLGPAALRENTRSRTGEPAFSAACDLLAAWSVAFGSAYALRDPAGLPEASGQALSEGHYLITLGDGDDPIVPVAGLLSSLLVGSDAVLGLLALGATNDFARTPRTPLDPKKAHATIADGTVAEVGPGPAGNDH